MVSVTRSRGKKKRKSIPIKIHNLHCLTDDVGPPAEARAPSLPDLLDRLRVHADGQVPRGGVRGGDGRGSCRRRKGGRD